MTRQEAIRIIENTFQDAYVYKYYDSVTHQALNMAIEALQMADRPKGLWTITTTDDGEGGEVPHLICSVCGNEPTAWSSRQFFNFCPNCGADMRGDK